MTIVDLAKECGCIAATIRKWIKAYAIPITLEDGGNHKDAQSLSDYYCNLFRRYWNKRFELPSGYVTVPSLANDCGVDRKTIRLWAHRNKIALVKLPQKNSPPTDLIDVQSADIFRKTYKSHEEAVPIHAILKKYGVAWKVVNKWIKQEGKTVLRVKGERICQLGLSHPDATQLEKHLQTSNKVGHLYMVQLIPEYNPNRVKFGFAYDVESRVNDHRIACPNAKLLATWRCSRRNERPAIKAITKEQKCKALTFEVFECEDFNILLNVANHYFNQPISE